MTGLHPVEIARFSIREQITEFTGYRSAIVREKHHAAREIDLYNAGGFLKRSLISVSLNP